MNYILQNVIIVHSRLYVTTYTTQVYHSKSEHLVQLIYTQNTLQWNIYIYSIVKTENIKFVHSLNNLRIGQLYTILQWILVRWRMIPSYSRVYPGFLEGHLQNQWMTWEMSILFRAYKLYYSKKIRSHVLQYAHLWP